MEKTIEIPEGYEARIEGNKVILEPNESKDEKIRKQLIGFLSGRYALCNINTKDAIAYLEKQKEQQPAEWSEEDETCLEYALWCVMKTRHFVAKDACDLDACRSAERWLKSLRPQPYWKPSEEQMKAFWNLMRYAVNLYSWPELEKSIESLYNDLKKL